MGWRGTLRSIEAAARRAERDARRQHNELLRQQKQHHKMLLRDQARLEVQLFENRIELLRSIHKECGPKWDWLSIKASRPPAAAVWCHEREITARAALDNFQPSFWDKLFRRAESKKHVLRSAVEQAQDQDAQAYATALSEYQTEFEQWQERTLIAERVLDGDLAAYKEVLEEISPYSEIADLGSTVHFRFEDSHIIDVTLTVNGQDVIPTETKSLLQSGKMSTKKMPQGQFWELYQDYICGCVLRVANETFALLPFKTVVITAVGDVLNTQSGHLEVKPLLSVAIPRRTLEKLDLNGIDPSDSMRNFVCRMDFRKTKGFMVVEKIEPLTLA
ncbi:MAG TPA: hypothetical protein VJT50_15835 [Pyrinomonadaceae bacterium]|nr:hypothetical protein [Pyrinomonadaceae bacterium]